MIRELIRRGKKRAVLEILSKGGIWTKKALENKLNMFLDRVLEELVNDGKIEKIEVFVHDRKPPFYRKAVGYRMKW